MYQNFGPICSVNLNCCSGYVLIYIWIDFLETWNILIVIGAGYRKICRGVGFRLTISGGPRYHGWSHWAERIMPLIKSKEGSSSLWLTSVTLDPCCIYLICIWRRCIVVMDFDCYTGDRGLIPTQLTMIHKLRNLRPGSTHVLWGKLGSQSKVLTGHWIT